MGGEKRVELCWDTRPITSVIRDLNIRRRLHGTTRTSKGFISKTTTLDVQGTFWYISLPSLLNVDVKLLNFAFYGGRKIASTKLSFSIWFWIVFLGTQLKESSPTCDKASELKQEIIISWSLGWNNSDEDWKNTNSILKRRFLRCRRPRI